jgi:hypothetical protein
LKTTENGKVVDQPASFRSDFVPDRVELRTDYPVEAREQGVLDRQIVDFELCVLRMSVPHQQEREGGRGRT